MGFLQQDVMVFRLRLLADKKSPGILFLDFRGQFRSRQRSLARVNHPDNIRGAGKKRTDVRVGSDIAIRFSLANFLLIGNDYHCQGVS